MKTKTLYVLISNGADGSFYPRFTFNSKLIAKLEKGYNEGLVDSENCPGCDGDGFHYERLNIPETCTSDSLGISLMDDFADQLFN